MEMGVMAEGDEVIVPANTYIASILAITENRLVPVLVEPDISTLQIDDTLIERAITTKTRAVMIVHLYGRCAYTERIAAICRRHNLKLIEDNAQAHGCRPAATPATVPAASAAGPRTGALGHAAAHSFYPTKNLGAFGDAGAVTTDDAELAATVCALGNYGSSRKYIFPYIGRNSRLDELQAAILDAKLLHLDAANARRQQIAAYYLANVHNPHLTLPTPSSSVYHIFPLLTPHREALQQFLADRGVETQIHYPVPPHRQDCYPQWHALSLPITERIHAQELSIPCHPAMTQEQVHRVVALLNQFAP
jgi:dTDP-4-amino-4,6-dideoxygalactose transaminase